MVSLNLYHVGLSISKAQLEGIFQSYKSNQNGQLTFEEFKTFICSEEGNRAFKDIVNAQSENRQNQLKGGGYHYVPTDFRTMLEFISWKLDRENIIKQMEEEDKVKQPLDFKNLFANSDIGSNVNLNSNTMAQTGNVNVRPNYSDKALKLMVHQAKRKANTSH